MIDRQYGKIVIECDSCDAVFNIESGEWKDVWAMASREGWTAKKIGKEWIHGCPKCGVE